MSFHQLFDEKSSSFTYLISDDVTHEAVLIDPVLEQVDRDLRLIRELGLSLKYTLETHVHADHITSALAIKQATSANTAVGRDCRAQGYDRYIQDNEVILFGREEILAIATPGHTPGSVSYLWRDRVFTGDALLIGGCGRTDFQNGNPESLYRSITERLFHLNDQVLVYPAHDYKGRRVSSIGEEKAFNARVAGKSLDDFIALMNNLNLPMPKHIHEAVPANLSGGVALAAVNQACQPGSAAAQEVPVRNVSVQQFAALAGSGKIIDSRTPGEFASLHIAGSLNFPYESFDPSRIKALVGNETPLYCLCQTGTRSQLVAGKLRRAGFENVVHVDGGINAWESAGLPLIHGVRSVPSLERQARIAAGILVLVGLALGYWFHPLGYAFSTMIAAGLIYSGATNSCTMARLLAKLPWNQT